MSDKRDQMQNQNLLLNMGAPLKFGTSGLRALVSDMTDIEVYINTIGFILFLKEKDGLGKGDPIAVARDLRVSSPGIMAVVMRAIEDSGYVAHNVGAIPSPALCYYAISKGMAGIMVTGSHIPEDRNGIKFIKRAGEVLKSDESVILKNVSIARENLYSNEAKSPLFDEKGMFKYIKIPTDSDFQFEAMEIYKHRYLDVYNDFPLRDKKIVLYKHSAVGRDTLGEIFESLGAEVVSVGRCEKFVPVDTEKISVSTQNILKNSAIDHKPFAIISTDGDSDRPLLADENGVFVTGDKLGGLAALYLKPDFVAVPVSVNDSVVNVLKKNEINVSLTKIGSPYVVEAMAQELKSCPNSRVVSWESNGGFLLGTDFIINEKRLSALPTRDAVLPLICVLLLAIKRRESISCLVKSIFGERHTYADVVDNKTKGLETYTAQLGAALINAFSLSEDYCKEVHFKDNAVKLIFADHNEKEASCDESKELIIIRDKLRKYFSIKRGFSDIVSINFIDGIRITFERGEVSHLRPSGNAPEFRNYAVADSPQRAKEIVDLGTDIISQMVNDLI